MHRHQFLGDIRWKSSEVEPLWIESGAFLGQSIKKMLKSAFALNSFPCLNVILLQCLTFARHHHLTIKEPIPAQQLWKEVYSWPENVISWCVDYVRIWGNILRVCFKNTFLFWTSQKYVRYFKNLGKCGDEKNQMVGKTLGGNNVRTGKQFCNRKINLKPSLFSTWADTFSGFNRQNKIHQLPCGTPTRDFGTTAGLIRTQC